MFKIIKIRVNEIMQELKKYEYKNIKMQAESNKTKEDRDLKRRIRIFAE